MIAWRLLVGTALLAGWGCAEPSGTTVFAAASTTDVVQSVASAVDPEAVVSVGASSVLARQIASGAPADVYVSADSQWVDWLRDQSVPIVRRAVVAGGQMVVVGPPGASATDLGSALAGRVALADPTHVPAGRYARQSLARARVWYAVEPRVVVTGDVRAALAAVETGAADRAVVYASDVARARVRTLWTFPPDASIRFEVALLTSRGDAVYQALTQPEPWRAAGFGPAP